jgi:hypothetical protein
VIISERDGLVCSAGVSQPVPNLSGKVGKFYALILKGFPNLPNLPNLSPRVRRCACMRARAYVCTQGEKKLGRLGRLGTGSEINGFDFPTSEKGWEQVGKDGVCAS